MRAVLAAAIAAQLGALEMHELRKALQRRTHALMSDIRAAEKEMRGGWEEQPEDDQRRPFAVYEPIQPPEMAMPLADILDQVADFIRSRVAGKEEAVYATALWAAGTWGVRPGVAPGKEAEAEPGPDIYPFLHLKSGGPGSGKTTMMATLASIAAKAYPTDGMSASALLRTAEKYQPTFFLDEVDTWVNGNEGLRGLINSGHRRTGSRALSEKVKTKRRETFEPTHFRTFAPLALAGLGRLAATIEDRAIHIIMRKIPGHVGTRIGDRELRAFRDRFGPHLATHGDKLARIMAKGIDRSRLPKELSPRACDNWEPLFCVADLAGGEWPDRTMQACLALGASKRGLARGEQLLADLWEFQQ